MDNVIYLLNMCREFRYLGAAVTNQTCVHGEIKSRINSGNASYSFVQNFLPSRWISINLKVTM